MRQYKLVLVGPGGSGKSTFVKRYITGEYQNEYIPTLGVEVYPLTFQTTIGPIQFNIWDCAGQPKFAGMSDGYYVGLNCAIVMTDSHTLRGVTECVESVCKHLADTKMIVLAVSKHDIDIHHKDQLPKQINMAVEVEVEGIELEIAVPIVHTSAKTNEGMDSPFLVLARLLTNDHQLEFLENIPIAPPEASVDLDNMSEEQMDANYRHVYKSFWPNGNKKALGNYDRQERKHGKWTEWRDTGRLWKEETWCNGELMEGWEYDARVVNPGIPSDWVGSTYGIDGDDSADENELNAMASLAMCTNSS